MLSPLFFFLPFPRHICVGFPDCWHCCWVEASTVRNPLCCASRTQRLSGPFCGRCRRAPVLAPALSTVLGQGMADSTVGLWMKAIREITGTHTRLLRHKIFTLFFFIPRVIAARPLFCTSCPYSYFQPLNLILPIWVVLAHLYVFCNDFDVLCPLLAVRH